MAGKDYKQMIQRGKWLEEFLKPELKSWDHKRLALQFIDIYQVDFEFSKNDPSIQMIEEIEKNPENYGWPNQISYNLDVRIQKALLIKNALKNNFQAILSSSKPWGYQFSEGQLLTAEDMLNKHPLPALYNSMVKLMSIGEDGIEFKRVFTFGSNDYNMARSGKSSGDFFHWDIAAARMFFDFLFLGGQDYFLFCKYCGNFSVIERKGRKIFCSDICKTKYRVSNLT